MMTSSAKCLDELEMLSSNKSLETQQKFLKRITDLFFITQDMQGEEENQLFSRVMMQIIGHVGLSARIELSKKLAKAHKAPVQIVNHLASDQIEVAEPVLRHSPSLSDQVLLNIIDNKVADHINMICARPVLSEVVTDALLSHCSADAVSCVLENKKAQISPSGFDRLIDLAAKNDKIRAALLLRDDKPEDCFDSIKETISYAMRTKLLEEHPDLSSETADEMSFAQADRILRADQLYNPKRRKSDLLADEDTEDSSKNLTQYMVIDLARNHQEEEMISVLASLSNLEEKMVNHIIKTAEISALGIFCKHLHFSRDNFLVLLELKEQKRHLSTQVVATALKRYDELSHETAVHIMKYLKERFKNII